MEESRRLESVHDLRNDNLEEYAFAWFALILVIGLLFAFDVTYLQKPLSGSRMSVQTAVKLTLFWIATATVFELFILGYLGWEQGVGFMHGYFLEYMMSFDNLFVFQLVFAYYCTPEALLYKALCYGIAGAIALRAVFLVVGCGLLDSGLYFFKFLFGVILIWSGVKSVSDLDDEESSNHASTNRFIGWITRHFPVSDTYDAEGRFFVYVAEVECVPPRAGSFDTQTSADGEDVPRTESFVEAAPSSGLPRLESFEGSSLLDPQRNAAFAAQVAGGIAANGSPAGRMQRFGSDSFEVTRRPANMKRKASMLLLVVIQVWIVDLIFAVDSVVSKVALVDNVFLNCASAAFAMLSLRSLYFVMESLVKSFQMLKYGIAAILVLIGIKLIFAQTLAGVPPSVTFAVFLAICAASIASSYWMPNLRESCEQIDVGTMSTITEETAEELEGLAAAQGSFGDTADHDNFTNSSLRNVGGRDRDDLEFQRQAVSPAVQEARRLDNPEYLSSDAPTTSDQPLLADEEASGAAETAAQDRLLEDSS
jgi:predicted tellurium resistance membrane protein TerC